MPSELNESRVREIMECWGRGIDMRPVSRKEIASLCRHFLASPMTAGEFAGLVAKRMDGIATQKLRESKRKTLAPSMAYQIGMAATAWSLAARELEKLAREHNITIAEPTK